MRRLFALIASGLIGGLIGYFVGVFAGCDWLYPNSNLCGIYGLLLTGPIGLIVGAAVGWRVSRRPKP